MAKQLDLQEQEQLDDLKAFWKEHGNLITWVLVLALLAFAGWNGWRLWERTQAEAAAGLFEELDKAVLAGDATRVGRAFSDLKERYPRTAFAQQAGLIAARVQSEKGQADAARAALAWVADNGAESEYKTIARLRLAGVLMEAKQEKLDYRRLVEAKLTALGAAPAASAASGAAP
jgi:predicted negative regulator of RcsB-dependent stress response